MKLLVIGIVAFAALAAAATYTAYTYHRTGRIDHIAPRAGDWVISTVMPNGQPQKFGSWNTREECEAAIAKTEAQQHAYGSQCFEDKPALPSQVN